MESKKAVTGDSTILKTIAKIAPVDSDGIAFAKERQESLAKPPGSLGKLESIAVRLAGIVGAAGSRGKGNEVGAAGGGGTQPESEIRPKPWERDIEFDKTCVLVFCGDNGVAEQGVASAPQSVTRAQTINFTRRLTGVGALAESFGSELLIVDMGIKDPIPNELYDNTPFADTHKIIDRSLGRGTCDISRGPAMTFEEAVKAMETGIEMATAAAEAGYEIIGIGEMGIGNTTTSAAVLSALTGMSADTTCGRGGGVNNAGFNRKIEIVDSASEEFRSGGGIIGKLSAGAGQAYGSEGAAEAERPEKADQAGRPESADSQAERLERVLDVLARCGGFDICAMTGAYLGAAACRIPVVIDGYISVVAALAAAVIEPQAKDYMFPSHRSAEPGYSLAIDELGLEPFLDLEMRLGEGSGCPIAFTIIKGAWDVMRNMATFDEAEINDDYLEEIRNTEEFRG